MGEATSARRRRVGAQLRHWRVREGLTLQDVADRLEVSLATASRWETGRTKLSLDVYSRLADLYRVGDDRRYFEGLCRDADDAGWWASYSDVISHGVRDFMELEAQASREFVFCTMTVPGLLQTADYRRAVVLARGAPDDMPRKADLVADMNSARQALLTRLSEPFELHAVIQEAVLLQEFEEQPEIMRDQLRRLKELSGRGNVVLQIVPLRKSVHAGANGDFTILVYDGGGATVYNELLASSVMTHDPEEVDAYRAAMKALVEDVALPVDESLRLLRKLAR
ncbi:helix-turn-helix transcriptional regulator [Streptomyces sp. NBC_00006]|uniref:helix-turn-helix domain-containing protein n=1 Tax=unclassified Streptomyces TaxID=2593676 RepID=UPI0022526575|nr:MULTISPECIES: helix-turn-helix transcriptional regulator [unclassified Streptomyces]MCX4827644.1 helix-turn-helix transcriptional regulator [Streptomyces sp. NBC_01016]MCX5532961.1 helix-turn-helix transcriptional regulator [Streptomyces sp. NBC_00006]